MPSDPEDSGVAKESDSKVQDELGGGARRNTHAGRKSSEFGLGHKRRNSEFNSNKHKHKRFRGDEIYYPTGGNIRDPLNLNSVKPGDVEPKPFVKDFPLKVKIPGTKSDPLNLSAVGLEAQDLLPVVVDDPIVSPISRSMMSPSKKKKSIQLPEKKKQELQETLSPSKLTPEEEKRRKNKEKKEYFNKKYCFGNFDRYYGTRLNPGQKDVRLSVLKREWFEKKTVLDVGCNAGFLTLNIAKEYCPRRILGIDIDDHLVGVARKNIRHYCDRDLPMAGKFPASFTDQFGPISQTSLSFSTKFPDNVWFRKENFVLESDELLELVEADYDVILALSVTKWIHLNWGDEGMRRFFKRAFRALLPGGRLVLEPQPFPTYRKRSNMTETTKTNYASIEFKPEDFEMYLIEECGFESVEHLGIPEANSKGYQRPMDVYRKALPEFMKKKEKDAKKVESNGDN